MIRTLDLLIEHEEVEGKFAPVNLEILYANGGPSTISVHYLKKVYEKEKTLLGPYHEVINELSEAYEFNCSKPELRRVGKYKGNFQEKGFRWGERMLKEYLAGNIKRREKRRVHKRINSIINRLEHYYKKATGLKEKENYQHFIKILKKVNVNPDQRGKQLNLIEK